MGAFLVCCLLHMLMWQVRAEFLDILLAVLCFTAPEIEGRLRQVGPGRGRAGAGQVAGAAQLFALADSQPEAEKKVSCSCVVTCD